MHAAVEIEYYNKRDLKNLKTQVVEYMSGRHFSLVHSLLFQLLLFFRKGQKRAIQVLQLTRR